MTLNYELEWTQSTHFARVCSGVCVRISIRQVGPTCIVFGSELRCTKNKIIVRSVFAINWMQGFVNHIHPFEVLF
jgi:hypothetical protein